MSEHMLSGASSDETPALGTHLLDRPGMRVVDLSIEIYEGMPIFPAHQRPFVMVNQTHDGWRALWHGGWVRSAQLGDERAHRNAHRRGPGVPRGRRLGRAHAAGVLLAAGDLPRRIARAPPRLAHARGTRAGAGQQRAGDPPGRHRPAPHGHAARTFPSAAYLTDQTGLNRDAARWLAERGVVNIGIDAVAIDHSDDEAFSGHMICAEYRISNTENLVNLDNFVEPAVHLLRAAHPLPERDRLARASDRLAGGPTFIAGTAETLVSEAPQPSGPRSCLSRSRISVGTIREALAQEFDLTEEELQERLPSGRQLTFVNRVAWALAHMKIARLVESPRRGVYRITQRVVPKSARIAPDSGGLTRV